MTMTGTDTVGALSLCRREVGTTQVLGEYLLSKFLPDTKSVYIVTIVLLTLIWQVISGAQGVSYSTIFLGEGEGIAV